MPGKPATAVDDKNAPKADFKVDYPEVPTEPNYLIVEKTYQTSKPSTLKSAQQSRKKDPAAATAPGAAPKQVLTIEQKKALRQKELLTQFDAIRALPFSLAVVLRLNQPEEMKPITPVTVQDPVETAKGAQAAAGAKKPEPAKPAAGKK